MDSGNRKHRAARQHYRDIRKIDPARGGAPGDNTQNDGDRLDIGPPQLAFGEWAAAGLELPDLRAMWQFRWERLTQRILDRCFAGLSMFDPLNIRCATDTDTDSTNMQIWNAHNPFRAVLLTPDGHMIIRDYKNSTLSERVQPAGQRAARGRVDHPFLLRRQDPPERLDLRRRGGLRREVNRPKVSPSRDAPDTWLARVGARPYPLVIPTPKGGRNGHAAPHIHRP